MPFVLYGRDGSVIGTMPTLSEQAGLPERGGRPLSRTKVSPVEPLAKRAERLAGLQEVLDHPDDDLPRLMYADWLMEHGTDRQQRFGQFIKLQIDYHNVLASKAKHLNTPTVPNNEHAHPGGLVGPVCAGYDPDDGLPRCPVCRARVKLERHLKDQAYHGRYRLQGAEVREEQRYNAGGGPPVGGTYHWHWVRGMVERLTTTRTLWADPGWRREAFPSFLKWPVRRVDFEDAAPVCRICCHVHWGRLADRDTQGRARPWAQHEPLILPDELFLELPEQLTRDQVHSHTDYRRGWYPPWGSPEYDEWNLDARAGTAYPPREWAMLERRQAEARDELSAAAIRVARREAEGMREEWEERDSDARWPEDSDDGA